MGDLRHHWLTRDAVVVVGPDASAYLQGQLSQDVDALGAGGSAWSWLLAPQGKVDALVRVTRTGADRLVVDTDAGWGEAVLDRLTRFKLRTRVELGASRLRVLALRGGPAPGALGGQALSALWAGEDAVDVLSPAGAAPGEELDDEAWEAARILAGVPAMGAELTERTIPAETGLVELTVSFTKGCYTGQELVARIDSRGGHVARHLRLLRPAGPLEPGTGLTAGAKTVGTVTSASQRGSVALGYVGRAVEPGDTVDAAGVLTRVEALPERH